VSTSFHLGQALAYLLEGQLQAEREGQDKRMLQIRAAKRYTAKIKLEIEREKAGEKQNAFVTDEVFDRMAEKVEQ